ncbi:MAG: hypothetical protein K9K66_18455 [Desulfarculaceae bacterium]|nr:hypothetical protein [Desulfarculaceae bacterium]MCF8072501.1 hypothetical protein [Desulfarculaceae bacterium]MCF8103642.1 hypothetical protein [Desulfarculaceae bacterium]MCF8117042.1 hypothetical protein [Desulfarculaceae bacterium]
MPRVLLILLVCLLLALGLAGGAWAQAGDPRDPGFDQMRYEAVHGRPPPPPDESASQNQSQNQGETQSRPMGGYQDRYMGKPQDDAQDATQGTTQGGYQNRYMGKPQEDTQGDAQGGVQGTTQGGYQNRYTGDTQSTTQSGTQGRQTETTTTMPQYRFGRDSLLNPSDQGAAPPTASGPPAGPSAPGSAGLSPSGGAAPGAPASSRGRTVPAGQVPTRPIQVQVSSEAGQPIPMAKVTVTGGVGGNSQSGFTNGTGIFVVGVPCYRPSDGAAQVYRVQVVSQQYMDLKVVNSNRYNCTQAAEVNVVLGGDTQERKQEQEYLQRKFLYQREPQ